MEIEKTKIEGLLIITPKVFGDERGFFVETFNQERYLDAGINYDFVQDNLSKSSKGVLRGLHYQKNPYAQGKLVQVISGSVFDVAVDIRFNSPTFGKYVAVELSEENHRQFWIPPGFAHGFLTLEDNTLFNYKCTNLYSKESEDAFFWNDSEVGIEWPFKEYGIKDIIVSDKDKINPPLKNLKKAFEWKKE